MSEPLKVKIRYASEGLYAPLQASPGASGYDLCYSPAHPPAISAPGKVLVLPTGIALEIPEGYEGQIRPRSGLASKHLLTIVNSPGTIDSDYRGEISICLINLSDKRFMIEPGMRIAQIVFTPVCKVEFENVCEFAESLRGNSGFGSTGIF